LNVLGRLALSRATKVAQSVLLVVIVALATIAGGRSLAARPPRGYQSSTKDQHPNVPRVFKVDLRKGYVLYVFPNPQWQTVRVLFYRHRRGRFRVS